jgi:O-antigen/teichoic acid export membrane protein
MFLQMGIGAGILRQYQSVSSPRSRQELLSSALFFTLIVGALLAASGLLLARPASAALLGPSVPWIYLYLSFVQLILGYVGTIPYSYLRAQQETRRLVTLDIVGTGLLLCLTIIALSVLKLSILGVLLSAPIANLVKIIVLTIWVRRDLSLIFNRARLRELLAFGAPLIVSNASFFVLNFSDRFFLQHFQSLEAVGLYSVAYKFGFMLNFLLIQPFNMMWQARMYIIHQRPDHERVFGHVLVLYSTVLVFAALGIALFSPDIMTVMVNSKYAASIPIVPLIAAGYVFLGLGEYFQMGMFLTARTGSMATMSSVVAALTLILNYVLIPRFGIFGAAWATVTGFVALAIGSYYCSQRVLSLKLGVRRVGLTLAIGLVMYLLSLKLGATGLMAGLAIKTALLFLLPALLWLTGVFSNDDLAVIETVKLDLGRSGKKFLRPVWLRVVTAFGQTRN